MHWGGELRRELATTAALLAGALSKGSGSGFGDSLVLFAAPAADADGAYYLAGTL
jgi:hypothetical protein